MSSEKLVLAYWSGRVEFPDDEQIPEEYRGKNLYVNTSGSDLCVDGIILTDYALECARDVFEKEMRTRY